MERKTEKKDKHGKETEIKQDEEEMEKRERGGKRVTGMRDRGKGETWIKTKKV